MACAITDLIKKTLNIEIMKYSIKEYGRHLLYTLLAAVVVGMVAFAMYTYANNLKEDIERKKEIQRLENEKLRLEIEILKKANGS